MLQAVIFDLDGVIVNSEPLHMATEQMVFESLNIHVSEKEHLQFVGRSESEMWDEIIETHNITTEKKKLHLLKKELLVSKIEEQEQLPLMPGIRELMSEISNQSIDIAVASSSNKEFVHGILNSSGLMKYCKVVVTSSDVKKAKPAPDIYLKTLKLLEVQAKNCVAIEDSANGVNSAKTAGLKVIGLMHPEPLIQNLKNADFITDSLENISIDRIRNLL